MRRVVALVICSLLLSGCASTPGTQESTEATATTVPASTPGLMAVTPFGAVAHVDGVSASVFYVAGTRLSYAHRDHVVFSLGDLTDESMVVASGGTTRTLLGPAPGEQWRLQGLSGTGEAILLGYDEVQVEGAGIQPSERWLRFVDVGTGETTNGFVLGGDEPSGAGRASATNDLVLLSMRSKDCSWFEFRRFDGEEVPASNNPRPEEEGCGDSLVSDGVISAAGAQLAFVETPVRFLDGEFGGPNIAVGLTGDAVQDVVLIDLDSGVETGRYAVPAGSLVSRLEPTDDGVLVNSRRRSPHVPLLADAPRGADFEDHGQADGVSAVRLTWDGVVSAVGPAGPVTYSYDISPVSVCSASRPFESEVGEPTNATGLGEPEPPLVLHQPTPAAGSTRSDIIDAARACDWSELATLIDEGPSPFEWNGVVGDGRSVVADWVSREASGEAVLRRMVDIAQWLPRLEGPFEWNGVRGDLLYEGVLRIANDGEWLSYSTDRSGLEPPP